MNQSCRYCECTNDRACPGGCHWHKERYCSACAEAHLEELIESAYAWLAKQPDTLNVELIYRDRRWRIAASDSGFAVFDHLTYPVVAASHEGVVLAPHYDAPELMGLFTDQARAA